MQREPADGGPRPHVVGTALKWPGDDDAFVEALQRCNNLEGYTGGEGGLYKRAVVPVKIVRDGAEEDVVEEITAYIYYQIKEPDVTGSFRAFPKGDWLAELPEEEREAILDEWRAERKQ